MVFLTKTKYWVNGMSAEAYEQYGDHDTEAPSTLVTKIWAHREQVIDQGKLPFGMTRWCTGEIRDNLAEMVGLEDTLRGFPRTSGV